MIYKIVFAGLLFTALNAGAQGSVQAESESGKPYLSHTISSGETLSSIARTYKLTVSDVAGFNKMSADKALNKGQTLRIPIKATNLVQEDCSSCQKVYYKVQPKEGLYRIGLNFGNVSTATIQKLNNLSGESVDIGQNLLVGYIAAPFSKTTIETAKKESETPKTEPAKTDKKADTKVAETIVRAEPPLVIEKAPPVDEKKVSEQKTVVATKQTPPPVETRNQTNGNDGPGLFAQSFQAKAGVSKNGTAAVFKSTSGWDDTKYYVLMSNAEPGTIIKVSNAANGKTVCAKILGELPAIKQNENILLRISNAAAAALGGGEDSLNVTVNY